MAANPWRGEVEIVLAGKAYVLRPTFAALSGIEQQLGIGLIALAGKLADGAITLEELALVIAGCAVETPSDIREALVRGGLANAIESIGHMLAAVFGECDET